MNSQRKDLSDEILKTARDMLKAYIRANPDSIRGNDPKVLLEIHKGFLSGLTSQARDVPMDLLGAPRVIAAGPRGAEPQERQARGARS